MKKNRNKKNISPGAFHEQKIFSAFLLILICITGCNITNPNFSKNDRFYTALETVFVEGIDVPDSVTVNESFRIRITGNLPDPSWEFDHFELFTIETTLTIHPIGRQNTDADVVAQVLVPFDEATSFTPTQIGMLKIEVIGRVKTVEANVTVVNQ